MIIHPHHWAKMFLGVSQIWKQNCDELTKIDALFGDGDHGITINKMALLIEGETQKFSTQSIHDFIEQLGTKIMAVKGGSAASLYGVMIGGLAAPTLKDKDTIDSSTLKDMFTNALLAIQDITDATIGDKTMMDSLIPAVNAASQCTGSIGEILASAADAAKKGAQDSKNYISKYGRAKSYKEKTIGTPDAGAVSMALFFQGLLEGFESSSSQ